MEPKDLNSSDANATLDSNATDANGTGSVGQGNETVQADPTWWDGVKAWWDGGTDSGLLKMLMDGGGFMWPLLILAIVGLAVVIERFRSLKMLDADDDSLRQKVIDLLSDDNPEEALEICENSRGPVAAVLANGLRKYLVLKKLGHDQGQIEEQVVKSMEGYGVHIVSALERHLPILATISSVAPMLGFLGTVAGMITAFDDIVLKMGEVNIVEAAASGISIALYTTAFGLIVGIPAYLFFNYFSSMINSFVLQVESTAAELIEVVTVRLTLDRSEEESARTGKPKRGRPASKKTEE